MKRKTLHLIFCFLGKFKEHFNTRIKGLLLFIPELLMNFLWLVPLNFSRLLSIILIADKVYTY